MNTETYCIAGRLRMLSRLITTRYNEAYASEGVTFTQAALLMHIFPEQGIRQTVLAKRLQIEKSAMSRDIQLMQKNGWLTDNIRSGLFLTESGTALAKRCHKIWKTLNQQVWSELGSAATNGLTALSEKLIPSIQI